MTTKQVLTWLDQNSYRFTKMAEQIWNHPEVGFTENYAYNLQTEVLEEEGFSITANIGGVSTAFMAQYGSGKPIIGLLGEFDALPGLSQQVSPTFEPVQTGAAGHGCGHHLLGTAGVEAVIALKSLIDSGELRGTIRYYGCPAEELLSGKTFMARTGIFHDLDCALTWHPGMSNMTVNTSMQALSGIVFDFHGRTAHAGSSPHLGRSALDAVELMNVGANYLREHIPDGARIHYQITNGGQAPNIVPDEASVYYFVRAATRSETDHLLERLLKVAQGAAMMTETEVSWQIRAGCYDTLPNRTLNDLMAAQANVRSAPTFTDQEYQFAQQLRQSLHPQVLAEAPTDVPILPTEFTNDLQQYGKTIGGSSDIGDVSWIVPMGQIMTTCAPVGVQFHTWQATSAFGSSIGYKGMHYAAALMALSVIPLLQNTNGVLDQAKQEFMERSAGRVYQAAIPDEVLAPSAP